MQRVALGRAIVKNVPVFLMDEPLSNLDAKLRLTMRSEIVKLHNRINCHDDLCDARSDRSDDDGDQDRCYVKGLCAANRYPRKKSIMRPSIFLWGGLSVRRP